MKKLMALFLSLLIFVCFVGCTSKESVVIGRWEDETKTEKISFWEGGTGTSDDFGMFNWEIEGDIVNLYYGGYKNPSTTMSFKIIKDGGEYVLEWVITGSRYTKIED